MKHPSASRLCLFDTLFASNCEAANEGTLDYPVFRARIISPISFSTFQDREARNNDEGVRRIHRMGCVDGLVPTPYGEVGKGCKIVACDILVLPHVCLATTCTQCRSLPAVMDKKTHGTRISVSGRSNAFLFSISALYRHVP